MLDMRRSHSQSYYLVVVPEDAGPYVEEFKEINLLVDSIRGKLGTPVALFPFLGNRMPISKGPHRYLLTPFGKMPLFLLPSPDEIEVEEDGYVGRESNELAAPSAASAPVMEMIEEDDVPGDLAPSPSPSEVSPVFGEP